MVCLGNEQRSLYHFWNCIQVLHFRLLTMVATPFLLRDSCPQFSSIAQLCPTLCDPMNHSTPGLSVQHQLPEFTQTHVHWVHHAILTISSSVAPSPPAPNPIQHQGLFKWVSYSHQVAKVLQFPLQHQSFQHWWGWVTWVSLCDPLAILLSPRWLWQTPNPAAAVCQERPKEP